MDTKTIVEKALRGEDYRADIEKFTDEEKTQLNLAIRDASDAAAKRELEKVAALRKENERLTQKASEKDTAVVEKFKAEQAEIAKTRFFTDFQVKPEDQAVYSEVVKTIDAVDKDVVYSHLKREYAARNADALLDARKQKEELEKNAAQFIAQGAGANSVISSPDAAKYSQAAKDLYLEWQRNGFKDKTLDDAQKLVEKGTSWKVRNLAD